MSRPGSSDPGVSSYEDPPHDVSSQFYTRTGMFRIKGYSFAGCFIWLTRWLTLKGETLWIQKSVTSHASEVINLRDITKILIIRELGDSRPYLLIETEKKRFCFYSKEGDNLSSWKKAINDIRSRKPVASLPEHESYRLSRKSVELGTHPDFRTGTSNSVLSSPTSLPLARPPDIGSDQRGTEITLSQNLALVGAAELVREVPLISGNRLLPPTPERKYMPSSTRESERNGEMGIERERNIKKQPRSTLSNMSPATSKAPSIHPHDVATTSVTESACGRLIKRAFTLHGFPALIDEILSNEDGGETIRRLAVGDAQALIDVIDDMMDTHDLSHRIRKKCLKLLYKTCGHHARLPSALAVPVSYDRTSDALYRGGYADVWKGTYRNQDVAVKVIRTYSTDELQKIVNMFCKEVMAWRFLRHPHVLPLIGVLMSANRFAMVSTWMANGNINQYVKTHPEANRLGLLVGVAEGLTYLHGNGMVHGDLKGANILIDETGNARLADFGLLTIISDPANLISSSSYSQGGTVRWMSPELIDPQRFGFEKSRRTESSDCYALGMVIYETISGQLPFHEHADLVVFVKVMGGEHPTREAIFPKRLWKMMELCWTPQPSNRPGIWDVLKCLHVVSSVSD